jgi:hypothetical protein
LLFLGGNRRQKSHSIYRGRDEREVERVPESGGIPGGLAEHGGTWAKQGKIEVRVNPVNNYRLFRRKDLQAFLDSVAKPLVNKRVD